MLTNTGFRGFASSAYMVIFALSLCGCILAVVPLIIYATRGSSTSTATVLINRDAATVYADAVTVVNSGALRRSQSRMTQSTLWKEPERGRTRLCKLFR